MISRAKMMLYSLFALDWHALVCSLDTCLGQFGSSNLLQFSKFLCGFPLVDLIRFCIKIIARLNRAVGSIILMICSITCPE
jgi:hypothetical protein